MFEIIAGISLILGVCFGLWCMLFMIFKVNKEDRLDKEIINRIKQNRK